MEITWKRLWIWKEKGEKPKNLILVELSVEWNDFLHFPELISLYYYTDKTLKEWISF